MKEKESLTKLFKQWSGTDVRTIVPLPLSGSARNYYRISGDDCRAIGVSHNDDAENLAFVSFARHFKQLGISVPEIYSTDLENQIYLQQDLGDQTLFDMLQEDEEFGTKKSQPYLSEAVKNLSIIQVHEHKGLDSTESLPFFPFATSIPLMDFRPQELFKLSPSTCGNWYLGVLWPGASKP